MKKLSIREIRILIVTVALAVIFIAYQAIFKPISEGNAGTNDRLNADMRQLVKARKLISQKALVEARWRNLVDLIGTGDSEGAQMTTIISNIESAAHDSNVHIANISPQKSVAQKDAEFQTVELEIDGEWLDIVQFLYKIQQRPNFYFINELNLEKYSDSASALRGRIVVSRMCLTSPEL